MENSRIGCLTRSGIIIAVLAIVVLAVVFIWQGGALFSPGPLNAQAGKPLGGVTLSCRHWLALFNLPCALLDAAGMANRCMKCHTRHCRPAI